MHVSKLQTGRTYDCPLGRLVYRGELHDSTDGFKRASFREEGSTKGFSLPWSIASSMNYTPVAKALLVTVSLGYQMGSKSREELRYAIASRLGVCVEDICDISEV